MATASGPNVERQTSDQPTAGITTFTDDTIGTVSAPDQIQQIAPNVSKLTEVPGSQTIVDFLSRPTRIANGALTATDATKLFEVDPWALQLAGIKAQKLSGVGLLRADIVVRLEINAVRFQAGRYILAWFPCGGLPSNGYAGFYRSHTVNLQTITQLPHVEIDLAKETHVTLRIPYTSNVPFLPVTSTGFQYGTLFMVPYYPLIPGASDTTCSYTVWASFDNIHLSAPAIPQSNFSVARKEQKAAGTGPISDVAVKVGKTASILGEIPLLTPVMNSVSWISSILGRSASVWGFSKPVVLSQPTRFVRELFPYQANADNGTSGTPLSLLSTNEVPVKNPLSITDADEMSIDFIKSQYAYAGQFTWATTDAADAQLAELPHTPWYYTGVGSFNTVTPIALLNAMFWYWRGSIKFRFKLVKTEFHSGRLLVSYTPTFGHASPTWTIANTEYTYREIVDIRDTSEFEITVPYVLNDPWIERATRNAGILRIHVLDPLIAPSTVSSSVPILYEVCGGPDFDVAVPRDTTWHPHMPAVPMSNYSVSRPDAYQTAPPAQLGSTPSDGLAACLSIGEKVTSLRQVLKKTNYVPSSASPFVTLSIANGADQGAWIRPFGIDVAGQTIASGNTGPVLRSGTWPDAFSLIHCCYFASSGGVNLRGLLLASADDTVRVSLQGDQVNYPVQSFLAGLKHQETADIRLIQHTKYDPRIDVIVPHYQDRFARITHAQMLGPQAGLNFATTPANGRARVVVHVDNHQNTARDWFFARPLADDGSFFHWLGVPAVVSETQN